MQAHGWYIKYRIRYVEATSQQQYNDELFWWYTRVCICRIGILVHHAWVDRASTLRSYLNWNDAGIDTLTSSTVKRECLGSENLTRSGME